MKNLSIGLLLLAITELTVVVWFMYGQGFDRVAAQMVIARSLLLIPLISIGLLYVGPYRSLMERIFGKRSTFSTAYLPMLATCVSINLIGVGIPVLIVFGLVQPPSPFEELWMTMGGIVLLFGGLNYAILKPKWNVHWYALGFIVGATSIQWGLRSFVFSFF